MPIIAHDPVHGYTGFAAVITCVREDRLERLFLPILPALLGSFEHLAIICDWRFSRPKSRNVDFRKAWGWGTSKPEQLAYLKGSPILICTDVVRLWSCWRWNERCYEDAWATARLGIDYRAPLMSQILRDNVVPSWELLSSLAALGHHLVRECFQMTSMACETPI
jgi:hypothetical protein